MAEQTAAQPTDLANIVRREPTHLGFYDALRLGTTGVWLYQSCSGKDLVWRHPWSAEIIANLVSSENREGTITNSDLEVAALVLHKANLIAAAPDARLAAPCSGSDNTLTVSWSTKEAPTINPVVADLLRICALHLRQFFVKPSLFGHPGIENFMADDPSCIFGLSDASLLAHMSAVYPQPHSSWEISLPPSYLLLA